MKKVTATHAPNTPDFRKEYIYKACQELFSEANASEYIAAINLFVRQHVENPTKEESHNLYNILKLMEVIPRLEYNCSK